MAFAAILLAASACSPQCGPIAQNPNPTPVAAVPTPSPSPTPTAPLAASSPPFHGGEVGLAYSTVALAATGGLPPYKWSVSSGALPDGLTLGGNGSLAGSPTVSGTFTFTIQVSDAGSGTASLPGTISIAPALTVALVPSCAEYCNVELGCVAVCGTFGQLSGGVAPYGYTLTQGPLPAGTSLAGLSLTGTFIGQSGWLQFAVQVTDALGAVTSIAPKFWMYPHLNLTGGAIPSSPNSPCWWTGYDPVSAPGCRAQLPYSGGTPNSGTISVSAIWAGYTCNYPPACTNPPPMPAITVGSGMITVSVPRGYSSGTSGYTGTLTITLTNHDVCAAGPTNCSSSANLTITQLSG